MNVKIINKQKVSYTRKGGLKAGRLDSYTIYTIECKLCTKHYTTTYVKKTKGLCNGCSRKGSIPWNKGKSNLKLSNENSPNWKGGKYISSDGYQMVKVKNRMEEVASKWRVYKREHTYVMETILQRPLNKGEVVHHINYDKLDNDIKNLWLTDNKGHANAHQSMENIGVRLLQLGLVFFNTNTGEYVMSNKLKVFMEIICE